MPTTTIPRSRFTRPCAPSTAYTLTIDGTLRDITGATVPGTTLHFTTAPLKPFAYLLNQNGVSTFYAGAPTRVYLDVVNVSKVTVSLYRLSGGASWYLPAIAGSAPARPSSRRATPCAPGTCRWTARPTAARRCAPPWPSTAPSDRLPPGFYYVAE